MTELEVGRPPGTSPGWTIWHLPSGMEAIHPVRYKADAKNALAELMDLDVDWSQKNPIPLGSVARDKAYDIYAKYAKLRREQLANNSYWPRPKGKLCMRLPTGSQSKR